MADMAWMTTWNLWGSVRVSTATVGRSSRGGMMVEGDRSARDWNTDLASIGLETIHLVMDPRQLDPEIPCLMWTPDPPYVTGRLKLAMHMVYKSGMYLSQSTWPTL